MSFFGAAKFGPSAVAAASLALGACAGQGATEAFSTGEQALSGVSDDNFKLPKWTKGAAVTAVLSKPASWTGTEACLTTTEPVDDTYGTAGRCPDADKVVLGRSAVSKAWALPADFVKPDHSADGLKTVYAVLKLNGKVGRYLSSTILVDTKAPEISATFAGGDRKVTITLNKPVTDSGGSGVVWPLRVYATSSTGADDPADPTVKGSKLNCSAFGNVLECAGLVNGTKYKVGVFAADNAGNMGTLSSAVITPKTATPPTAKVLLADGNAYVSSANATWSFDALAYGGASVTAYKKASASDDAPESWTTVPRPGSRVKVANGANDKIVLAEGANHLNVWVKDSFGNESARSFSTDVFLDSQAPTLSLGSVTSKAAANGFLETSVVATVTDAAKLGYASGVATPQVSYKLETSKRFTALDCAQRGTSLVWDCSTGPVLVPGRLGAGAIFFSGSVTDRAGNVSSVQTLQGMVLEDDVAPTLAGDLTVTFSGNEATLTMSAPSTDPDLIGYLVAYRAGLMPPGDCLENADTDGGAFGPLESIKVTPKAGGTNYTFRVCAVDIAGNVSQGIVGTRRRTSVNKSDDGTCTLSLIDGEGYSVTGTVDFSDVPSPVFAKMVVQGTGIAGEFNADAGHVWHRVVSPDDSGKTLTFYPKASNNYQMDTPKTCTLGDVPAL